MRRREGASDLLISIRNLQKDGSLGAERGLKEPQHGRPRGPSRHLEPGQQVPQEAHGHREMSPQQPGRVEGHR